MTDMERAILGEGKFLEEFLAQDDAKEKVFNVLSGTVDNRLSRGQVVYLLGSIDNNSYTKEVIYLIKNSDDLFVPNTQGLVEMKSSDLNLLLTLIKELDFNEKRANWIRSLSAEISNRK